MGLELVINEFVEKKMFLICKKVFVFVLIFVEKSLLFLKWEFCKNKVELVFLFKFSWI